LACEAARSGIMGGGGRLDRLDGAGDCAGAGAGARAAADGAGDWVWAGGVK
jgi:hypothetical protein